MEKLKPTLVLSVITTIVAALLIVTYNLTYSDTSNILTEKLKNACIDIYGEGEYEIVQDWKIAGYPIDKPENIQKLIKKSDGSLIFEIVVNGYAKNGIDIVVGVADGKVMGLSIVDIAETPGLGTKINDKKYLDKFINADGKVIVVKNSPQNDGEIQAITGATYSSNGVAVAVNIALDTYNLLNSGSDSLLTDKLKTACIDIYGDGEYEIISDWKTAGYPVEKPENIKSLIKKSDGSLAFEIVTDGYAENSIDIVVGVADGNVTGLSIVDIFETPGLGTKVNDKAYLDKFKNVKGKVTIVKDNPQNDNEIQAVSGATYSSKGVAEAVNIALETYEIMIKGGTQ